MPGRLAQYCPQRRCDPDLLPESDRDRYGLGKIEIRSNFRDLAACRLEQDAAACPAGFVPVFHGTSAAGAQQILRDGMRLGSGWQGRAAYFTTTRPQALCKSPGECARQSSWSEEWAMAQPAGAVLQTCLPEAAIRSRPRVHERDPIGRPLDARGLAASKTIGWGTVPAFPSGFTDYFRTHGADYDSLEDLHAAYDADQERARREMLGAGVPAYYTGDEIAVYDEDLVRGLRFRALPACATSAAHMPKKRLKSGDEIVAHVKQPGPRATVASTEPLPTADRAGVILFTGRLADGTEVATERSPLIGEQVTRTVRRPGRAPVVDAWELEFDYRLGVLRGIRKYADARQALLPVRSVREITPRGDPDAPAEEVVVEPVAQNPHYLLARSGGELLVFYAEDITGVTPRGIRYRKGAYRRPRPDWDQILRGAA